MKYSKSNLFKWLLWFILGIGLILTAHHLIDFEQVLASTLIWLKSLGTWGAIAFIIVYTFATLICVPGSILALGGGALFGAVWGAILVFIGGFIGAMSAFSLSRYFLKDWVKRQLSKRLYLQAINQAIAGEGWKFAFLLHLSPIIPFNILNYALGVSKLAFQDYTIATAIGIFPGVILYTFLGSTIGDLTMIMMDMPHESHSKIQWIFTIAGLLITALLAIYLGRVANQNIKQKLD